MSEILRVTSGNQAVLDRVAEDVFDEAIDAAQLAAYVAAADHALYVAVEEGVVVGHVRGVAHLQPDAPPQLYIDNLGVTPSHQRRGIATQLVEALFAWARVQGCTVMWVATEPDNALGLGFYEAMGFKSRAVTVFETDL